MNIREIQLLEVLKKDKVLIVFVLLSLFSLLRSLVVPLYGDELTYVKIGEHILEGRYYLFEHPSTVTPVLPFMVALFYTFANPVLGFILMKCTNILLAFLGFRFLYLFLKEQNLNISIVLSILLLTLTNTHSIAWFSSLYPESILFFSFWGFVYYYCKAISVSNFKRMLLFFLLLTMTRYLYTVLGVAVIVYYYRCFKSDDFTKNHIKKILFYSVIYALPVLFWFKYVYLIEQNNLSEISYFDRFKEDSGLMTNILSGLGLEKHPEVSRINGIPAFVSLFVPITGFRHYLSSLILIGLFLLGYIKTQKPEGIKFMFYATILVMLGLVFAGTGFSRYWLVLLPCFYLGYYYVYKDFKFNDAWFLRISKIIAIVYVINEIRLDYLIIGKYL
ncbi:hypothetical protein ES711_14925 [Gelidibacter salicanalis]|uniref:Glycosyltransferase RgtA/B/C/D-like domain-containing protein n=1 Tax=Gelidibacter salicanalis TaxID=291193 RepID=A0A5C7ABS6_9FLAO|nr:hypothetical protein [Gelidibacter salicanalis]TXE05851.1 hypothetical protein ES711_14925 [Gelidibacter salicanalis]